jgi:hypothetical protein
VIFSLHLLFFPKSVTNKVPVAPSMVCTCNILFYIQSFQTLSIELSFTLHRDCLFTHTLLLSFFSLHVYVLSILTNKCLSPLPRTLCYSHIVFSVCAPAAVICVHFILPTSHIYESLYIRANPSFLLFGVNKITAC